LNAEVFLLAAKEIEGLNHPTDTIVPVWDLLVRIFHWSLVLFFFLAYFLDDDLIVIHSYAGYGVFLLLLFRLLWGFIGTVHAQFADFIPSPFVLRNYLRDLVRGYPERYLGHNPAGAAMIILLATSLLVTTLSGICLFALEGSGPLSETSVAHWPGGLLENIHNLFADLTLMMVVLHVGGVFLSSFMHRENLIKAMISGKKKRS